MLQQAPYLGVPSYRANTFLQAPDGSQPHPRPNHKAHTCFQALGPLVALFPEPF